MNTRRVVLTFAAALLALGGLAHPAEAGQVEEIVKKANLAAYYQGKDGRAKVRMTIVDEKGRTRVRQFSILRRNDAPGGDQQYLLLFTRPADVRRTVFMVKKHLSRDDDRWMYLPALDLVKRIAASDKRTSFVGSHFFYEDISGRGLDEDHHKLLRTTDKYFVVQATPKRPGDVEFKYYTVWIDKKTYVPMKMEYVNKAGKVYRRIETLQVQTIDGYPTATKMKATDLERGGYTLNEMKAVQHNIDIPAQVFAERSLRSPPQQWFGRR